MFCAHCGNEVATLSANCPSCSKPASGAPALSGKGGSTAMIVAIIVGGGLVLVAIVGIIAAIAIPNLLNAIERGRQKRTMADMRSVATASEAYAVDYGFYPDASSIDELAGILSPVYINVMPQTDGWENLLAYQCWQVDQDSEGCDSYVIASPGRDGMLDFPDLREYADEEMQTNNFDEDIVFSNGYFTVYPGS